jgi:hypothetical protein
MQRVGKTYFAKAVRYNCNMLLKLLINHGLPLFIFVNMYKFVCLPVSLCFSCLYLFIFMS